MLVKHTSEMGSVIDGRTSLVGSPFRSIFFCIATIVGFISVSLDAYLVYRYWKFLGANTTIVLAVLIGVQLIYQWLRIWRYNSRIRELYSMRSESEAQEGTPLDVALRISLGGLTDVLFYSYGMTLLALTIIGALLKRLGGSNY